MRTIVTALLALGFVGTTLVGCPKKYNPTPDAAEPAPAGPDGTAPAATQDAVRAVAAEADTVQAVAETDAAQPVAEADSIQAVAEADAAQPAAEVDTTNAPAPRDEDAAEPASGDATAPAPEADTAGASAPEVAPRWAVLPPAQDGGPSMVALSSQGGGAKGLTEWIVPLALVIGIGAADQDEAFVKRCSEAKTRPPELAVGATVYVLTAAGPEPRKITGLQGETVGGAGRVMFPLDGAPLPGWSVAAIGEPAPSKGTRFVSNEGRAADPAVTARVRAQLVAFLPAAVVEAIPDPLPAGQVWIHPAALGPGRTALITVCIPGPDDPGSGWCALQALAIGDGAGEVTGWLRMLAHEDGVKAPTLNGFVPDMTFGNSTPLGVLYSGDDVAILVSLDAIGDEIYDLIHLEAGGVRVERLFEMIVE